MARSYLPSKVSEIVAIWRNDLSKVRFLQSTTLLTYWKMRFSNVSDWDMALKVVPIIF